MFLISLAHGTKLYSESGLVEETRRDKKMGQVKVIAEKCGILLQIRQKQLPQLLRKAKAPYKSVPSGFDARELVLSEITSTVIYK